MHNIKIIFLLILAISACKPSKVKTEKHSKETPADYQESKATTDTNQELAEKINIYLTTEYLSASDQKIMTAKDRKYQLYEIDLNGDGVNEIFINFITPYFCGTAGCNILIISSDMKLITQFTVMDTPIYVHETLINGWKTLFVKSEGTIRKLSYLNDSYPTNPSVAEVVIFTPTDNDETIFYNMDEEETYTF